MDEVGNKKEKFYKKSLEITERKSDVHRTLDNYTALGILAQETGNLKKALDYHNKALMISTAEFLVP